MFQAQARIEKLEQDVPPDQAVVEEHMSAIEREAFLEARTKVSLFCQS